ncbi:aspartic proteinase from Irpex Lacteus [Cubamyces lactineus]|nr:aspartic proteinase from Irpex Lacteus [Cubamyces lactineus]
MSLLRLSLLYSLLLVTSYWHATAVVLQATPETPAISSMVTLPIAKRFNFTGPAKMLQQDQARARNLHGRGILARGAGTTLQALSTDGRSIPAENLLASYVVTVNIGSPPNSYELIVDTGSSNTWIGAGRTYVQTVNATRTSNNMTIGYNDGSHMSGAEFTDTVQLGSGAGLTIAGQSIGVASEAKGFDGFDGVFGLGRKGLTVGTLSPDVTSTIPTVTENLFSQGRIASEMVSISFEPTNSVALNGELTFGGVDSTKFIGDINFAPITTTSPSSEYFGVDQAVRYGASHTLLANNPGIFDTGTSLVLIASDALQAYVELVGAELDPATGLYRITPAQYEGLQSMFFTINNVVYEFTANAQIWPRNLNQIMGGSNDFIYLMIGDLGRPSGSGLDIINGMMFLERFYTVYDTENHRVGIANTPFTMATTN